MTKSQKQKLQKFNNIISFVFGFVAVIVAFGDVEDLNYWYVPFVAMIVLVAVVFINGKVNKRLEQN